MDTSEQYIKMCDCKEIQSGKRHSVLTHYKLDTGGTIDIHGDYIAWVDTGVVDYTPERADRHVWLPRQDQLQEMVIPKPFFDWRNVLSFFDDFIDWDNLDTFGSMEQLWLAFVMKEKFNKTWDGEWKLEK